MTQKTLFQQILDGDIEAELLYQDQHCGAFRDINPQGPVHFLVVPREPLPGIADMQDAHESLIGHLFTVANQVAREQGLTQGYRLVINQGEHGQQTVPHLHLHVIGGRQMQWPPG